ncbi:hypothetical protein CCMSSC00406_0004967 [Pleurotus cornucopiae]|uniref:Uncharacterized protein n=1 Tax=Pleurotus cornucopiae TaxID=5321 RepID=A0ACB7IZI4_PLECO|nr:hypothetical protein CCMSSC00406_0004967 [Pleurotus cornucopiae]
MLSLSMESITATAQSLIKSAIFKAVSVTVKLLAPQLGCNSPEIVDCTKSYIPFTRIPLSLIGHILSAQRSDPAFTQRWLALQFPTPATKTTYVQMSPSQTSHSIDYKAAIAGGLLLEMGLLMVFTVCILAARATLRRSTVRASSGCEAERPVARGSSFGARVAFSYFRWISIARFLLFVVFPAVPLLVATQIVRGCIRITRVTCFTIVPCILMQLAAFLCNAWSTLISVYNAALSLAMDSFVALWHSQALGTLFDATSCCAKFAINYQHKSTLALVATALARLIPDEADFATSYLFYHPFGSLLHPTVLANVVILLQATIYLLPSTPFYIAFSDVVVARVQCELATALPILGQLARHYGDRARQALFAHCSDLATLSQTYTLIVSHRVFQTYVRPLHNELMAHYNHRIESAQISFFSYFGVLTVKEELPAIPRFPAKEVHEIKFAVSLGERLGSGAFGSVYKATSDRIPGTLAVKVCVKKKFITQERLWLEASILATMGGHYNSFPELHGYYEGNFAFNFVMRGYTGGTIESRVMEGRLDMSRIQHLSAQLLLAIHFLHCQGIIHRDIKPPNVLLDGDDRIVLTDFGVSHWFPECYDEDWTALRASSHYDFPPLNPYPGHPHLMSPLNDSGCTPNYAAPEVRLGLSYSYGIDFWSFGATLHWVFTGKDPVVDPKHDLVIVSRQNTDPTRFPVVAHRFLERILDFNPRLRFRLSAMMNDEFFTGIDWEQLGHSMTREIPSTA